MTSAIDKRTEVIESDVEGEGRGPLPFHQMQSETRSKMKKTKNSVEMNEWIMTRGRVNKTNSPPPWIWRMRGAAGEVGRDGGRGRAGDVDGTSIHPTSLSYLHSNVTTEYPRRYLSPPTLPAVLSRTCTSVHRPVHRFPQHRRNNLLTLRRDD